MTHRVGFKIHDLYGGCMDHLFKMHVFYNTKCEAPPAGKMKFRGARCLGGVAFKGRLD